MFSATAERISNFFGLNDGNDDFKSTPAMKEPKEKVVNNSNVNHSYFQRESRADTTNTYRPVADVQENNYRQARPKSTKNESSTATSFENENAYRPVTPKVTQEEKVYQTSQVKPSFNGQATVTPKPVQSRQAEVGMQENVRVTPKVVQINKNRDTLQEDMAVEKTVKKVSILEPRTYTESKNIAKCIFRNEIVIVNFHLVEESQARRIVDFLTGAVYALDGDIQRLGAEIFICTPPNTEIDSAVAKSLLSTQFNDF